MRAVLAQVAVLPRREQDVVALCVWSGLSHEAAAAALGVPVGTDRSRRSRARGRLRRARPTDHLPAPVPQEERPMTQRCAGGILTVAPSEPVAQRMLCLQVGAERITT